MDFYWVYDLHNWQFALLLVGAFVTVAVGGMLLTRPLARRLFGPAPGSNEIVGDILQASGVFYGITLGLVAVGAWTSYGDVQSKVVRESVALGALYRDSSCLPEPTSSDLQNILRRYTRYVIDHAWPLQRKGIVPPGGVDLMDQFQARLRTFKPQDAAEQVFMHELFRQYNVMMEARRLRLQAVTTGMPAVLWLVVLAGAAVNILLVWCLVLERLRAHAALLTLLATLIGLLIFLTAAMDNPFRGEVSVGPEAFELIYDQLMDPV